jgi:membrane-bound serine protease (ClpP class)
MPCVVMSLVVLLLMLLGACPDLFFGAFEWLIFKFEPWSKKNIPYNGSDKHPLLSVGQIGVSETPLRPCGKARFDNHKVEVVSNKEFIEKEMPVTILSIRGNHIVVEYAESEVN